MTDVKVPCKGVFSWYLKAYLYEITAPKAS